jgi:hypothetical protein
MIGLLCFVLAVLASPFALAEWLCRAADRIDQQAWSDYLDQLRQGGTVVPFPKEVASG